jgi:hypothetical protein
MTQICQNCAETEPNLYAHDGEVMTKCCDEYKVIEVDDEWVDLGIRYFKRYNKWNKLICKEIQL